MLDRLARRWERLAVPAQIVVSLVGGFVFMFLLHLGPFRQPLGRAISYSVFWGLLLAAGLMVATRAEQARRRERQRREDER